MINVQVVYNGKTYWFKGDDSIALIDRLTAMFGKIVYRNPNEHGTELETSKGATAYLYN